MSSKPVLDMADALSRFMAANPDLPAGEPDVITDSSGQQPTWPRLDISYERKGRGGRPATIISGFGSDIADADIDSLAADLRRSLATGGSARGGEILLQGDRRQAVQDKLKAMGIKSRIIS